MARELNLPAIPFDYESVVLPSHVAEVVARFDNQPIDNPISNHGATLGRVLFYDPALSRDGSTSCASCHLQANAFAEPKARSVGFAGGMVRRNSMSLVNLRYYRRGKFFWDERAESLEQQVLMPIEDPIEMGHHLADLQVQLQHDPIYPRLFAAAFGDEQVTRDRIAKALAQFVRSIVSFRSRYDEGRAQVKSALDPFPNFSEQENLGKEQFFGRGRCAECHLPDDDDLSFERRQTAFFQLLQPIVNGIDNNSDEVDRGVGEVSGRAEDNGKFKSSSLRNIELTGPYMHDGRFHTLDQVLEHYNWSVRPHDNLDPRLEDFAANGMALPEVQKVALAVFLKTLTDQELIHDPKYSDPFVPKIDSSADGGSQSQDTQRAER